MKRSQCKLKELCFTQGYSSSSKRLVASKFIYESGQEVCGMRYYNSENLSLGFDMKPQIPCLEERLGKWNLASRKTKQNKKKKKKKKEICTTTNSCV